MATASSDSRSSVVETINNSPKIRRNHKAAPWVNIVRAESELLPAAPSSNSPPDSSDGSSSSNTPPDISAAEAAPPDISDHNSSYNNNSNNNNNNVAANKSKKPAWNTPSNGNGVVEVSPVMGAVSWPALSDSAKASPKSSSESLKALADGSVPASAAAAAASQGAVVAIPQQKPVNANPNPNLGTNHHHPVTRQKSGRRNGGFANNNGGSSQLSPRPQTAEMPQNYKTAPVVPGTSPRDHQKNHVWESGQRTGMVSQGTSGNDHQALPQQQPQRSNSFRRGSGGHHRGDGNNHYSHGNRREDRANHDSNPSPRGFNGRDGHMQPRVNQRNFVRPMQPSTAPFISPPPVRPFGFPDMASPVYYVPTPPPESLRAVPFFPGAPFMILPGPDPQLRALLAKQIEYYFSPENLCKDIYLRKYMDAQGWVSISLIANFNRVKNLTNNIPFILDSVRNSTIVEIQGERIRKRNDWMNWLLQPTPSASDTLSTGLQSVEIDDQAASAAGVASANGPGDTKAALNRELQH